MQKSVGFVIVPCALLFAAAGCSTPKASVTFHKGTSDGNGYDFVVPRTAVRIGPTEPDSKQAADPAAVKQPKNVGSNSFSFTSVPVTTDVNGNGLPRFWVTSDSSGFSLTPTSVNSASYADNLILSAIGTQVTDNRTQAIDAGVSILGLVASAAGVGFAATQKTDCTTKPTPKFVLDTFEDVTGAYVPGTHCWGYNLKVLHNEQDVDPNARVVAATAGDAGLPVEQKVQWFPYPACRTVLITLYTCDVNSTDDAATKCVAATNQNPTIQSMNVSTGALYRRMVLPVKGKITFHSDFCGVDVADDPSGIQSNWALLKQAISDYNNLKQSKSTSSGK